MCPLRHVPRVAEDGRLEDVKGGQVDKSQHTHVQHRLAGEVGQAGQVGELFHPWLCGEALHSREDAFEDVYLVPVLEGPEVARAKEAEDEVALPVHFTQRLLLNHALRNQVRGTRLERGNDEVICRGVGLGENSVGEPRGCCGRRGRRRRLGYTRCTRRFVRQGSPSQRDTRAPRGPLRCHRKRARRGARAVGSEGSEPGGCYSAEGEH
mmetsp:Transcript_2359/g.6692  ORF Transcript_2359/g.6692 Transcript_2359/m.6692 type:complete len:209 (-) Transcript_2359:106-732(-)